MDFRLNYSSICDYQCMGNNEEFCGGPTKYSVYQVIGIILRKIKQLKVIIKDYYLF